jgi:hypothetical protein
VNRHHGACRRPDTHVVQFQAETFLG